MTMATLYRKVMCSDYPPKKSGAYDTNWGKQPYNAPSKTWHAHKPVEWWLEPVEEPTEEDITNLLNGFMRSHPQQTTNYGYGKGSLMNAFREGARGILSKLKGASGPLENNNANPETNLFPGPTKM